MPLTLDDFVMVPESQFGIAHLRIHPAWARYYEPDDIDVACSWGVDRADFLRHLELAHTGNDHAMFPVLSLDPLPDDLLDIYTLCQFTAGCGTVLSGYIASDVHFICLYPDDANFFSFNKMASINQNELARFQSHVPLSKLFPLQYETEFRLSDGTTLAGSFSPA